jgi:hypothetical protein
MQSLYSPDLALSDFWLFGHMKIALQEHKFEEPEQLLEGIYDFMNDMQPSELIFVFRHWIERMQSAIEHDGDYYHK